MVWTQIDGPFCIRFIKSLLNARSQEEVATGLSTKRHTQLLGERTWTAKKQNQVTLELQRTSEVRHALGWPVGTRKVQFSLPESHGGTYPTSSALCPPRHCAQQLWQSPRWQFHQCQADPGLKDRAFNISPWSMMFAIQYFKVPLFKLESFFLLQFYQELLSQRDVYVRLA